MGEKTGHNIVVNRKARHNYHILEKIEAGIALLGTEVKSVREGHMSIAEAYVVPRGSELWLEGCRINPYEQGGIDNHDPMRPRKLLLKRREIEKLRKRVQEKGLTLIPLRAYFKGRVLKVEVGLAEGKKQYDKREAKKERDVKKRMRRLTDI
jgi:SsrA-binding protein